MSKPAFRLRLPCIPYVPAIEGSLISSCLVQPPPGPCFIPPVPPPPPPSFGCYEMNIEVRTYASGTAFGLEGEIKYPNRDETGYCQPLISLRLRMPSAGDSGKGKSGGGSGSSSGSAGGEPGTEGRTRFSVLVDVTCDDSTCDITKYYKTLEYDDTTLIVYWVKSNTGYYDSGS